MLQRHSLGKSRCSFLFVPHEINSQPHTEGEPIHEAWRKIQFLTYLSRISHKKLHAWSFPSCWKRSEWVELVSASPISLLSCLFLCFLFLGSFQLQCSPSILISLHKNHIYFNKYSVPESKHWRSDSAFLTMFPWPGTDPDTHGHALTACWRHERWKGYVHPL